LDFANHPYILIASFMGVLLYTQSCVGWLTTKFWLCGFFLWRLLIFVVILLAKAKPFNAIILSLSVGYNRDLCINRDD
jgi:hypothetical protein